MPLDIYNKKRNFDATPEPEGIIASSENGLVFVVQRHHASQLHYDFRIELNGTLKSWAVPKGPSMNPKDKRLAMMTEDHPLAYAAFEGDIPEGHYGAGHMDIWDTGTYQPVDDKEQPITDEQFYENLQKGNIKMLMHGSLLKGVFALKNIKDDGKTWLLMKHKDQFAVKEEYNSEAFAKVSSLAYTEMRQKEKAEKKK